MPPVYSAERVARTIVNLVRVPRREVIVGPMGRTLVMQTKFAPGLIERQMALQVDKTHLYRTKPAPATDGNLYRPPDHTDASTLLSVARGADASNPIPSPICGSSRPPSRTGLHWQPWLHYRGR